MAAPPPPNHPSSISAISDDLRCRTWTRCGLRELMSIITPSRFWRGVGREGSAAATYSPSSLGEIAISGNVPQHASGQGEELAPVGWAT